MRGLKCQKRRLGCLAMTLAGFIFYALGVFYYSLLKEAPAVWHIVCGENSSQTEEDYERVIETWEKDRQEKDFPLACAFWKKEEGQTAENLSLNRTCDVTVWKVRGSSNPLPFLMKMIGRGAIWQKTQPGSFLAVQRRPETKLSVDRGGSRSGGY